MSEEIFKNNFEFSDAEINDEIKIKVKDNFKKLISKLKSQGALPERGSIQISHNPKNGELEFYFIKDKNGEIIEFTDLRKGGTIDYRASIKDKFAQSGIILKAEELKQVSTTIFLNELKDETDRIDESTATKN